MKNIWLMGGLGNVLFQILAFNIISKTSEKVFYVKTLTEKNHITKFLGWTIHQNLYNNLIEKKQSGLFHIASTKKLKWLYFLTTVASIINAEDKVIIVDNSDWVLKPPYDSSLDISKITSIGIKTTSFDVALNTLREISKS